MRDVIKKLQASVDLSLGWTATTSTEDAGEQVFSNEKDAIGKLMDLEKKSSIPVPTLQGMIDTLVQADQILANDAIADAVAASGDPNKIAQAQDELSKAADELSKGHFDTAIDHYNAWKHAQEAVHH